MYRIIDEAPETARELSLHELTRALQQASDDVLRFAGETHAATSRHDEPRARDAFDSLQKQHALAENLIERLLALPASRA